MPMPDRSRIAGEWIAPALTITSRASISSPPTVRTPVARRPSTSTRSTSVSPRTSRFDATACGLEIRVVRRDASTVAQGERHAAARRSRRGRGSRRTPGTRDRPSRVEAPYRAAATPSNGTRDKRDRPAVTVQTVAAVVEVVLDAQERVEHLRPPPSRTSEVAGPTLVVVDGAADRAQRIDRRRSARARPRT